MSSPMTCDDKTAYDDGSAHEDETACDNRHGCGHGQTTIYCQADLCQQLLPVLEALHITLHAAVQALLLLQLLDYEVSILHV